MTNGIRLGLLLPPEPETADLEAWSFCALFLTGDLSRNGLGETFCPDAVAFLVGESAKGELFKAWTVTGEGVFILLFRECIFRDKPWVLLPNDGWWGWYMNG